MKNGEGYAGSAPVRGRRRAGAYSIWNDGQRHQGSFKSYKEAKLALDVGKIFFSEKDIVAYTTLGIGRLIYQLPLPLCKMFIKEILKQNLRMTLMKRH